MSARIDTCFARLRSEGRTAVIPYIACGDPFADATVDIMLALAAGGADVIELGVPFSDPMADGPVIQKASERALARGIGMQQVLVAVQGFRARDAVTAIVLMGYANPIEAYDLARGAGAFVRACAEAGVDGVLVVDYPPEESVAFSAALKAAGLAPIFLLAPTSTEARMKQVGAVAAGYVYYVSLKGVTGAGNLDTEAVARAVPRIRQHVSIPVGVGFGIRDAASAKAVAQVSDAVVIGSALIECLQPLPRDQVADAARGFIAGIRAAVDEIRKA
jgi:tryptophan synthase alpha chain